MIAHQKPLRDVALFSHACMQVFVVLVDHFPRACRPCCGCPSPRSLGKTCATTVRRRCCSRRCSTRRPRGQRRRCGRGGIIVRALPIQVFLMESSSWSLPHGRRCRFIVVRVRLHESSRRSRRPLSKGMVGAVHRECAPMLPPPLTPMVGSLRPIPGFPISPPVWKHPQSLCRAAAILIWGRFATTRRPPAHSSSALPGCRSQKARYRL